jgi:hypothetical protein
MKLSTLQTLKLKKVGSDKWRWIIYMASASIHGQRKYGRLEAARKAAERWAAKHLGGKDEVTGR